MSCPGTGIAQVRSKMNAKPHCDDRFVKHISPEAMRANPIIAIASVSVMVASVIGVAAITGVLPNEMSPKQGGVALGDSATSLRAVDCTLCGTVESIRTVEVRDEGGAASASEIDKSAKKRYAHRVTIRMDDGSYRTMSLAEPPALAVGDKVRVVEGKLVRA